jgi:hypothetical protein
MASSRLLPRTREPTDTWNDLRERISGSRKFMSDDPLVDPVRNVLNSAHAPFTVGQAPARRHPAEVAPFAVIDDTSEPTLLQLGAQLVPGEQVYIFNEPPKEMNGLFFGPPLHTFQMVAPEDPTLEIGESEAHPVLMTSDCAGEMFDLISLAFPGFYWWGSRITRI